MKQRQAVQPRHHVRHRAAPFPVHQGVSSLNPEPSLEAIARVCQHYEAKAGGSYTRPTTRAASYLFSLSREVQAILEQLRGPEVAARHRADFLAAALKQWTSAFGNARRVQDVIPYQGAGAVITPNDVLERLRWYRDRVDVLQRDLDAARAETESTARYLKGDAAMRLDVVKHRLQQTVQEKVQDIRNDLGRENASLQDQLQRARDKHRGQVTALRGRIDTLNRQLETAQAASSRRARLVRDQERSRPVRDVLRTVAQQLRQEARNQPAQLIDQAVAMLDPAAVPAQAAPAIVVNPQHPAPPLAPPNEIPRTPSRGASVGMLKTLPPTAPPLSPWASGTAIPRTDLAPSPPSPSAAVADDADDDDGDGCGDGDGEDDRGAGFSDDAKLRRELDEIRATIASMRVKPCADNDSAGGDDDVAGAEHQDRRDHPASMHPDQERQRFLHRMRERQAWLGTRQQDRYHFDCRRPVR